MGLFKKKFKNLDSQKRTYLYFFSTYILFFTLIKHPHKKLDDLTNNISNYSKSTNDFLTNNKNVINKLSELNFTITFAYILKNFYYEKGGSLNNFDLLEFTFSKDLNSLVYISTVLDWTENTATHQCSSIDLAKSIYNWFLRKQNYNYYPIREIIYNIPSPSLFIKATYLVTWYSINLTNDEDYIKKFCEKSLRKELIDLGISSNDYNNIFNVIFEHTNEYLVGILKVAKNIWDSLDRSSETLEIDGIIVEVARIVSSINNNPSFDIHFQYLID